MWEGGDYTGTELRPLQGRADVAVRASSLVTTAKGKGKRYPEEGHQRENASIWTVEINSEETDREVSKRRQSQDSRQD